jgi:16S rRNA (adenine1518-N6/adenine1519-N6)-dimethyltransferase
MIPKKSLGQNFLTNENIARQIVNSVGLSFKDNVLEIGPGKGILTRYLAKKAEKVLALEIDPALASELQKEKRQNTKIIEEDILKINLSELIEKNNFKNYKVVANLPYYITSKIIRLLLETKYPPEEMILMVQKEVGERIVALDDKESILSISVKFYADPELLFEISRENFDPAPEVDSVVVRIKRKKSVPDIDNKRFFSLVRAGFSSKRKMLMNNLSASFSIPKAQLSETLKKAGLDPGVRAERLGVENWIRLYDVLGSE